MSREDDAPANEPVSGGGSEPAVAAAPASPPAAPTGAQPSAVLPGAPAAPAPAQPQPPEPAAVPPAAATGTESATTGAAAPAELTPEKHREQALSQLKELYTLPDAEVEAFRVNPGEALSTLAAKLHYEIFMAMNQGLHMVMPQFVQQAMHQQTESAKMQDKFYGAWPRLKEAVDKNPAYAKTVVQSIKALRSLNPGMTIDDLIANAGMAAMITLKIPMDPPGSGPTPPPIAAAGATPPAAPSVPPRPPGAGAVGHVPGSQPASGGEESIFADLAGAHERGEI